MAKQKVKQISKKRNVSALDAEQVKMTTRTVTKSQLIDDYATLFYNIGQLKTKLTPKRVIKIYEKLLTAPFTTDKEYPVQNEIEAFMFNQLQELQATCILMTEALHSELTEEQQNVTGFTKKV